MRLLRRRVLWCVGLAVAGWGVWAYMLGPMMSGERGLRRQVVLRGEIASLALERDRLRARRVVLERDVMMLSEGTLDLDMLEERVRVVLGYVGEGEILLLEP